MGHDAAHKSRANGHTPVNPLSRQRRDTPAMQFIDLYRWRVVDKVSGRRYVTRYPMSEASAQDLDPQAERVEGSHERMAVCGVPSPAKARLDATTQF